jgi:hypothetical protein
MDPPINLARHIVLGDVVDVAIKEANEIIEAMGFRLIATSNAEVPLAENARTVTSDLLQDNWERWIVSRIKSLILGAMHIEVIKSSSLLIAPGK